MNPRTQSASREPKKKTRTGTANLRTRCNRPEITLHSAAKLACEEGFTEGKLRLKQPLFTGAAVSRICSGANKEENSKQFVRGVSPSAPPRLRSNNLSSYIPNSSSFQILGAGAVDHEGQRTGRSPATRDVTGPDRGPLRTGLPQLCWTKAGPKRRVFLSPFPLRRDEISGV